MSAFHRLGVPASLLLCVIVSELQGQSTPSPSTDAAAAYERDAILIEPYSLGDRVLQGKDRRVLAILSDFGNTRLADILAKSPKAADEARVYDRNHRPGAFLMLGGIIGLIAGNVASQVGDGKGSFPLWIGGTILLGAGSAKLNRAKHALPRAAWWYNYDLVTGK
jgi:hypothetical protein